MTDASAQTPGEREQARQRATAVLDRVRFDDKGDMVRAFMAEDPFKGHRPLFIGDDLTDEDGFAAAAKLDGYGVLVGSPRQSLATGRLPDVDAVLDWLQDAIETGGFRLPAFQ